MKKLLFAIIMLFVVIALTGCFEDRIYLDFKAAEEIESVDPVHSSTESVGPFKDVYVRYSSYFNEWSIKASVNTPCGEIQLEVDDSSLQNGLNKLKTEFECLKEKCK